MPDLEISNLPALAEAGVSANDPLAIADVSASETKKVTVKDLIEAGVALIDTGSIPSAKIATLAANQVATAAIQDDAVTNAKLEHSTISLGGISIALALSVSPSHDRDFLIVMTYSVVLFSIMVQGLTMGSLVKKLYAK